MGDSVCYESVTQAEATAERSAQPGTRRKIPGTCRQQRCATDKDQHCQRHARIPMGFLKGGRNPTSASNQHAEIETGICSIAVRCFIICGPHPPALANLAPRRVERREAVRFGRLGRPGSAGRRKVPFVSPHQPTTSKEKLGPRSARCHDKSLEGAPGCSNRAT